MEEEKLLSDPKKEYRIRGFVEPGFEPVVERYAKLFDEGVEKNSQLCIYHEGRKVVDIWGETPGLHKGINFNCDSMMNIFSCGKMLG